MPTKLQTPAPICRVTLGGSVSLSVLQFCCKIKLLCRLRETKHIRRRGQLPGPKDLGTRQLYRCPPFQLQQSVLIRAELGSPPDRPTPRPPLPLMLPLKKRQTDSLVQWGQEDWPWCASHPSPRRVPTGLRLASVC